MLRADIKRLEDILTYIQTDARWALDYCEAGVMPAEGVLVLRRAVERTREEVAKRLDTLPPATPAPSAAAPTVAEVEKVADVIQREWKNGAMWKGVLVRGGPMERGDERDLARAVLAHLGKGAS